MRVPHPDFRILISETLAANFPDSLDNIERVAVEFGNLGGNFYAAPCTFGEVNGRAPDYKAQFLRVGHYVFVMDMIEAAHLIATLARLEEQR